MVERRMEEQAKEERGGGQTQRRETGAEEFTLQCLHGNMNHGLSVTI